METRRLKYFVRIAEDGSLMRAAGVLRIAQPALSRQLRLLEEDLGLTLFRRTPRGMQLTQEGELLRVAVAGPLRELELALQNIRSLSARVEGNIVLGMPSNILPQSYFRAEQSDGKLKYCPIVNPTPSLKTFLSRRNYNQSNPAVANVLENGIIDFFAARTVAI